MNSKFKRFVFVLVAFCGTTVFAWADATTLYVQIREAPLRDKPSALGAVLGKVQYTAALTVLEVRGSWYRVRSSSPVLEGWIAASAVTERELTKNVASTGNQASSSEVALAGKGFSEDVEKQYKSDNNVDYTWIDKMEGIVVTDKQLKDFLAAGPKGVDQ